MNDNIKTVRMLYECTGLGELVRKGARGDEISSIAQTAADTHRIRNIFRLVQKLLDTRFPTTKPLMISYGVFTTSKEEQ